MVATNKTDDSKETKEVLIEHETVQQFCEQTFSMAKTGGFSMIQPYNQVFLTGRYMESHPFIQDFEVFDDDVWLCTFPKSGTRWMQEILWCIRNNMNFEKAKVKPVDDRVPFLDFPTASPLYLEPDEYYSNIRDNLERPRSIKTHLSYEMLPKQLLHHGNKAKIICLLRNPRDVCVSYLNHLRLLDKYTGSLETLTDIFLQDVGPYYAPYFQNVLGYWKNRHQPNVLVVFYEEMQKDIHGVIKKVAEFVGVEVSEEHVEKLSIHSSFKNMKANPMCNFEDKVTSIKATMNNEHKSEFVHKGKTGTWKEHYDEKTIKRFEEWETKWLKETGLSFDYEI